MSTTTNTGLNQPAYNSTSPTWDQPLNFNETILDAVLGNTTSVAMPTGASATTTLTGPTSTGSLGQTQAMRITLTGSLSANQILQFPSGVAGKWIIYNTTSGSFSVTVSSAGGGTAVSAPQGYNVSIYSDGTNIRYTDDGLTNNFATLTVLGNTYLATTSGNVGIGTSSPSYKLDVAQNSASNNFIGRFINTDTGSSSGAAVLVTQGAVTAQLQSYGNNIVYFGSQSNHPLAFQTNSQERMRIDSSGNVGIGTSSPTSFGSTSHVLQVQSSDATGYGSVLVGSGTYTMEMLVNQNSGVMSIGSRSNHNLGFATNDTVRATIDSSGNVGIGTTSPSTKLQVNGTVTATSYAGSGSSLTGIVTSNVAGTGITVSGSTGAVTISNSGVTSITGTASQITASASTGGVTLSLPSTINVNTSGNAANVTGTVAVANGGTGLASLTANNVILGNGTSAVQFVAPGPNGNVLQSNGSTWASVALSNSVTGTLIRAPQVLTNTAGGTYTTPASCGHILIEMIGAGAGGGGCTGSSSGTTYGGGGGGSVFAVKYVTVSASTGYTYAIGAAGTGTTGTGNAGGVTSIVINGTTYSISGGTGGTFGNSGSPGTAGATGTASNMDYVLSPINPVNAYQGGCVDSPYGISLGGFMVSSPSQITGGASGFGWGAGGAGAYNNSFTGAGTQSGGNGYQGMIRIWEYT